MKFSFLNIGFTTISKLYVYEILKSLSASNMWNYSRKMASVYGSLKGFTHLRSATSIATYSYTPKAYYGDHINCTKEKENLDLPIVKHISEYFIKPRHKIDESKQIYHLAPHDLMLLSFHHIHFGLMFLKPSHTKKQDFSIHSFLKDLKKSLSLTLNHFYPLAGQLVSKIDEDKHESIVYVDCNKGHGARFIHNTLDMTVSDILSPKDVPLVVGSFFDLSNEEFENYNGCSKPLLSIKVTELLDGIFIACSVNHCITDGTSYWQFWNMWSKIHRENGNHTICESSLPIYTRWYPDERASGPYPIPYTHPDEFVRKFIPPQLRDRIFHFPSESIARLKAIANEEGFAENISSFQALSALVWRSIVKANHLPNNQIIHNRLVVNNRERLDPPLPKYYFGNCIQTLNTSTTTSELLENNLGWAASMLRNSVVNHNDKSVREFIDDWIKSPFFYYHADLHDYNRVIFENSPKFNMYGIEFGLGKAVAFRTGCGNKGMGLVYACPGCEGGGSVDIEICLPHDSMNALELDEEFITFVSEP